MNIGKNSAANVVGAVVPLLVTFTTVPTYLRLIGEERYGTMSVIWVMLGYFGFFDLGLGRATTRQMAKLATAKDSERNSLLWTTLVLTAALGVAGGMILWLSADGILNHYLTMSKSSRGEAIAAVPWLVVALPLLLISSALSGALQGRERFFELNVSNIIGNVLNQLIPLGFAFQGLNHLEYLIPAALSGRICCTMLLFWFCRRHVPLRLTPTIDTSYISSLLSYGGWSSVISTVAPLLVTIDRMVIAAISGTKVVTYYSVPYTISFNCINLSGSLASAIFPRLSAVSPEEAGGLADQATRTLVAIMTPVLIVGVAIYNPFLTRWMGPEFTRHASGVGELILAGIWINSLVIPHYTRLQAAGFLKTILVVYLIQIPIYFGMLCLGLQHWGPVGAAAAWCARVALDTVMLLWTGKALGRVLSQNLFPLLIATGTMAIHFADPPPLTGFLLYSLLLALGILSGWSHLFQAARSVFARRASQAC